MQRKRVRLVALGCTVSPCELLPLGKKLSFGRRHKAACERDQSLHCCVASPEAVSVSASAQLSNTLQPPSAFAAISDPAARSRAIFVQAAKVLTHPRCMNCHPATDRVLQGN